MAVGGSLPTFHKKFSACQRSRRKTSRVYTDCGTSFGRNRRIGRSREFWRSQKQSEVNHRRSAVTTGGIALLRPGLALWDANTNGKVTQVFKDSDWMEKKDPE
jgi:hypothetical protein